MSTMWQSIAMLIRYCSVGAVNTAVGIGTMYILKQLGFHYAAYTAIAYALGFCVSYTLNSFFTFRAGTMSRTIFLRFLFVNLVLLLFTEGVQAGLIDVLKVPEFFGVAVGMVIYTGLGFLLNKRLVFRVA